MSVHMRHFLRFVALAVPALIFAACGGAKQKSVATPGGGSGSGSGLSAASNCISKDKFPEAVPNFSGNMAASGAFVGWLGEPVDWKITGVDDNSKDKDGITSVRQMTVLLNAVPEGS